jgi:hypothetical protein
MADLAGETVGPAGEAIPSALPATDVAPVAGGGGVLGSIGGGLSQVGSAIGSGLGAAGSAIGSAAGAIGGGLSSGLGAVAGAMMSNPWTIGVGAAILGVGALIKSMQVHPVANTFVQNVQNPFDKQAGTAFQSFVSGVTSGQLTQQQAIQSYQALQQMYGQYQQAIQQFGQKGSKEGTVANQAQQTFNKEYGVNGQNILGAMAGYIAQYYGPQAWQQVTGQGS